jgi:hypothetical protein
MTRKAFRVTDEMREEVRALAARGVRQEDIAAIVDCDAKTVRKHFRKELDGGMAEANAKVAGALFDKAIRGDTVAQIFWMKARAHWREGKAPENLIAGSDAELSSTTVIIMPDNQRDPELTEELQKANKKYFTKAQKR